MRKLLLLALILLASMLYAETMAGIYTVGGDAADYPGLNEAMDDLMDYPNNSIIGDIVLQMNPGTYTGPFVIEYWGRTILHGCSLKITCGADPTHQVIFTNHAATAQINYIFKIAYSDKITIEGFDFEPTGTYSRSILVGNHCEDITLQNNRFFNAESSAENNQSILFRSDDARDADNIDISGNQFWGGQNHIEVSSSSSLNEFLDWRIAENYHNGGYYGIKLIRVKNLILQDNVMQDVDMGLSCSRLSGDLLIRRNWLNTKTVGMYLSYCSPDFYPAANVYNNIIKVSGDNSYYGPHSYEAKGLFIYGGENVYAAHNSVELSSRNSLSCVAQITGTYNKFINNNFVNIGGGYVLNFSNMDPESDDRNTVACNNLYGRGANLGKNSNTSYQDLSDLQPFLGSTNVDYNPFYSDEDLCTVAPRLDNLGSSAGITVDYMGSPRSASTPDIGAWEYTSDPSLTPLENTYYIGSNRDYSSLNAFVHDLAFRGISGPVSAYLTDAVYEEQIIFDSIPGISSTRVVEIRTDPDFAPPGYATISYSAQTAQDNYVVDMYRSKYLYFNHLSFATAAQTYSNIMVLNGYSNDLKLSHCHFYAPLGLTVNDSRNSLICADYSKVTNLEITNSLFEGNGYGLSLRGEDAEISATTFKDSGTGLRMNQVFESSVANNYFENCTEHALHSNGIGGCSIIKNRVLGLRNGISLYNNSNEHSRTLVANNIIKISGAAASYGLTASYNSEIDILNNSIYTEGGNAFYGYQLGSGTQIVNNVFVAPRGLSFEITLYHAYLSPVIDYNSYYSESNYLAKIGSSHHNLSSLQAALPELNAHSVNLNPLWDEDMQVHSQHMRGIGQTRSEFLDDINGVLRGEAWDLGAQQQTGASDLVPLLGSYTVGSPTSDYPTIEGCLEALRYHGVGGNIVFYIQPGSYAGGYVIYDFPKADPTLLVHFMGTDYIDITLDPSSSTASENFVFTLNSVRNVHIQQMELHSNSATLPVEYIRTVGYCENVQIDYVHMYLPTANSIGINTGTNLGDDLTVDRCRFYGAGTALKMLGNIYDSNLYENVIVSENIFEGVTYPVIITKANEVQILDNQISTSLTGIQLISVPHAEIKHNTISANSRGMTLYAVNSALIHSNTILVSGGTSALELNSNFIADGTREIFNNYLYCTGSYTLNINNITATKIYHNTIINSSSSANVYAFRQQYYCAGLDAQNNIFAANSGYAAQFYDADDLEELSHNIYFSASGVPVSLGSTDLLDISAYITATVDDSSLFADPMLQPESYILQNASPAINAGIVLPEIGFDIDGTQRTLPDIGCYEHLLIALDAPQNVRIIHSATGLLLCWDEVAFASHYLVYYASTPDAENWDEGMVTGNSLLISTPTTARFYKVRAIAN